jgi:hypothetical protein
MFRSSMLRAEPRAVDANVFLEAQETQNLQNRGRTVERVYFNSANLRGNVERARGRSTFKADPSHKLSCGNAAYLVPLTGGKPN